MPRRFERSFDNKGSAAIEFAVVAPLLVLIIAAVVEYGRIFSVYKAVNRLASQYAISWADCYDSPAGTCSTEMALYTPTYSIRNVAPELTYTNVTLKMFQVKMNGVTPNVVYAYPASSALSSSQTSLAQSTFSNGQSGVVITVSYAHSLLFFPSAMSSFLGSLLTPSSTALQLKP
jgi:Flp pilus assembly protein TadG